MGAQSGAAKRAQTSFILDDAFVWNLRSLSESRYLLEALLSSAVCCSNLYENARPSWTLLLDFPSELPQTGFHLIPCFHMAKLYPSFSLFSHQPSPSIVKKHTICFQELMLSIKVREEVYKIHFCHGQCHFFATSPEGGLYHIGILLQGSFFLSFFRRRIVSYFLSQGNAGALANDLWAICRKN